MRVGLLPMGPVPRELLATLSQRLAAYGAESRVLPEIPVPGQAFDPRRAQYRAESLLGSAVANVPGDVVAVTAVDLYTQGLAFVFGLANAGASGAVVSVHRLAAEDADLVGDRLLKEAVHELGHTWGLGHCADPACVMHFSNELAETDAKSAGFCGTCRPSLPEGFRSFDEAGPQGPTARGK